MKRASWWRRAALAGATLALALAAVEGAARVFGLGPSLDSRLTREGSWWVADDELPYRPRPSSVFRGRSSSGEYDYEHRHNSVGLRDVEHSGEKPAGTFRLLALGDSFTNGWGAAFEETWPFRLETALNRRPGEHPVVEIIKAGIGGYSPEAELILLERIGLRYSPDLVLVAFTPTDVRDTHRGLEAIRVAVRGSISSPQARVLGRPGVWLFEHARSARRPLQVLAWALSSEPGWDEIYRAGGPYETAWLELEAVYEQMLAASRDAGARFAVLHIPVATGERDEYPARRLAAWCARRGVGFTDALPALRSGSALGVDVFWPRDGHPTPEGYRLIAEAVESGLLSSGLVP